MAFVAFYRATGSTPVTAGSKVPAWPAFLTPKISFTQAVT